MTEPATPTNDAASTTQRAQQALQFFEDVLADRGLLVHLDDELRRRLMEAAGRVARPDPWQKREFLREARRRWRPAEPREIREEGGGLGQPRAQRRERGGEAGLERRVAVWR